MSRLKEVSIEEPIIMLFKIGAEQHMRELLHDGHIYMKTLGDFKALDDGTPRFDPDEATAYCWQRDGGTFEIQDGEEWLTVGEIVGGIREHDTPLRTSNVYCLHARTAGQCKEPWKLDYLNYGESYVGFFNPAEFLRRVKSAAIEAGHEIEYGPVQYVDCRTYNGPMGAFRKFSERAVDAEFRILIRPGLGYPMSLRLGSLTDIAAMGPTAGRMKLIAHSAD
jgi:hypothetical protein